MDKIAIISTRLGGIDGVSIEADKWAETFLSLGLLPIYIAGDFVKTNNIKKYYLIEEMDFYHPEISKIKNYAFNLGKFKDSYKSFNLIDRIEVIKNAIKKKFNQILAEDNIKYFSVENALSIPLNIPLGIALNDIISEHGIKTITRHHDFYWERDEFLNNNVSAILEKYFPPDINLIKHVVINSLAKESLFKRKKIKAEHIPNIFNFKILDNPKYDYASSINKARDFLGIDRRDLLFLQPTRIIGRKNIERSIYLVEKLSKKINRKIFLFISGSPEKQEMDYFNKIIEIAAKKNINLILSNNYKFGNKIIRVKKFFKNFDIYELYNACDLVTLPSDIEGFGNPVIEAAAFKKPLFVNNYPVLKDIIEKGFKFIVIDKVVNEDCVKKVLKLLSDKKYREKITNINYEIAKKFYSFEFLVKKLKAFLN
jgi:glycosyltransferase involved in cell wall biosynthesis